ncbi:MULTISPECIES: histone-like nucleoid-structuring protein Lsr2 [Streptomyces]|uniref:Lsr2 family protein n=1 Tax=Streptomyces ehimensis TaxID=68195 RepID=A0ABV9BR35_9ACTN
MAQKIITIYTDDLTGAEESEASTHHFSLDGVEYEIDLGPDSYEKLLEALAPFMTGGRKLGRGKKLTGRNVVARPSQDAAAMRAWAKDSGYSVNERGRVPAEIREAYANR